MTLQRVFSAMDRFVSLAFMASVVFIAIEGFFLALIFLFGAMNPPENFWWARAAFFRPGCALVCLILCAVSLRVALIRGRSA